MDHDATHEDSEDQHSEGHPGLPTHDAANDEHANHAAHDEHADEAPDALLEIFVAGVGRFGDRRNRIDVWRRH